MALPLWGQLEKAQDDAQTIEQAIAEAITAHESDPEAHLGDGESLEMHKTEEIIDHPSFSVVVDKLPGGFALQTSFESITGWNDFQTGSASIVHEFGAVSLITGSTSGSLSYFTATPSGFLNFDASKRMFWRSTIRLAQSTDQLAFFGVGAIEDDPDRSGFGFRISDNTLFAYYGDFDDITEIQIFGVTLTDAHVYDIRYDPSGPLVEFFIDGVLVASADSGTFPSDNDGVAGYRITNTDDAFEVLYINNFMYQQLD